MENKKLIDILRSNGYLFPSTEKEITDFENCIDVAAETPADLDDPSAIIKRGLLKIEKVTVSEFEKKEMQELKMAARKGIQSIPKDILDKMKSKHKNGDK